MVYMSKKSTPLVSIIVPIYNAEMYLSQCIQSLLDQTYQNIEIILVNDGSTDLSGVVCDTFAEQDQRIKVINKLNEGVGKARNEGIKYASGDYISFVDADDWQEQNLYEHWVSAISINDVDIYQFGYYKATKAGYRYDQVLPPSLTVDNLQLNRILAIPILNNGKGLAVWDKIIKKELVTGNNIWFDNKKRGEDFTFVFKLLNHAKSIVTIAQPYYNYRVTYGSRAKFDPEIIENHIENYNNILSFFGIEGEENKTIQDFLLKLAVLWFLIVIPLNISNTKKLSRKEKLLWLRKLYYSKSINEWLLKNGFINKSIKEKFLIFIFRLHLPYLLYITARLLSFLRRNFYASI